MQLCNYEFRQAKGESKPEDVNRLTGEEGEAEQLSGF